MGPKQKLPEIARILDARSPPRGRPRGDGGCDEGTQEGKVGGMHSETEKYIQKLDLTLAMSGAPQSS